MKTLLISLLFASTANAGLCLDQFESCFKDYGRYCMGVKPQDGADEEDQRGAQIVNRLCLVGADIMCYKEVTKTFGKEVCDKENEESQKAPQKSKKPDSEAKSLTK